MKLASKLNLFVFTQASLITITSGDLLVTALILNVLHHAAPGSRYFVILGVMSVRVLQLIITPLTLYMSCIVPDSWVSLISHVAWLQHMVVVPLQYTVVLVWCGVMWSRGCHGWVWSRSSPSIDDIISRSFVSLHMFIGRASGAVVGLWVCSICSTTIVHWVVQLTWGWVCVCLNGAVFAK